VKADNVNVLADKKDKSFVSVDFTHGQVKGNVTRVLQPNPRQELTLTWGMQQKKVTRDAEITDQLEQLLSINQKMLLDYVFVQQWGIFKFIDQQPSVRARALAELFGADRAERIYRDLGDVKIDIPASAVDADIVRSRIQSNKQELIAVVNQLKQFAGMVEKLDDALKGQREVLKKHERREQLLKDIKDIEDNKLSRTKHLEALVFEMAPLMSQHLEMRAALDEAAPHVVTAKKGLEDWRLFDQYEYHRASISHNVSEVLVKLQQLSLKLPVQPDPLMTVEEKTQLDVVTADIKWTLKRYHQMLKEFDKTGKAECQTCGTRVGDMIKQFDEYKKFIREMTPIVDVADKQIREWITYTANMSLYRNEHDKLYAENSLLSKQLEKLMVIDIPSSSQQVFKKLISNFDETKKKYDYMTETLRIGNGKVDGMKLVISALDATLVKYQVEMKTLSGVGLLDADSAARAIDKLTEKYVQRDTLRNQKRSIERLIEDDEEALEKCKVVQLRAERLKQAESHLDEVREVYRQLITLIPQHNMEELRSEVNANLDRFNTRFRVEAIDDLRFLLRYHSGRVQPAERLSGGERVLLALAFRIAVNSRYAKELGLLCLDEPTAGLDEDNLNCLEVALGRLRELSQAQGLQVIMVTHDAGLDGMFDHVIKLQTAS
jgi:DNA repair exonuclease SbcCD ATPase subunit